MVPSLLVHSHTNSTTHRWAPRGPQCCARTRNRASNPKALVSPPTFCLLTRRLTTVVQHLKNRISSPFDFQHLTHTNRHHFAALQEAPENELANGFHAVRASQAPRRDLTGIKAENLHASDVSAEDSTPGPRRSLSAVELRPSPDFVDQVVDAEEPPQSPENSARPSLRQSRSVESFSRPGINPRLHRHTQSANAPPRMASRLPASGSPDAARANRQSGAWDHVAPLSPARLSSMAEEPDYMGHALTTPDNSAIHPMSPAFSPGLEDVAEEPERFVSPRPAPQPPNRSSQSPRSPHYASFSPNPRSPIGKTHARRDSHVLPKQLNLQNMVYPASGTSEALASPGLTRKHSIRKPLGARKPSNAWRVIEESWEDDIDYIYDNALEAECELDWESPAGNGKSDNRSRLPNQQSHQQISAVSPKSSLAPSPVVDEGPLPSPGLFTGNFRTSLLVPNVNNVPDLEPRSAISSSTADTRVHTPSDYFNPQGFPYAPFAEADRFSFAPSLLGSPDFKEQVPREDMYDHVLADYEGLDKHFPLLEPSQSVASSTRSSHARASKHSSYESSLMSSGHGSGSWTMGGVRRSGSSAGSLPELVHSSRNTRQDISSVVHKLTEEVDSLTVHDDYHVGDDDDVTPPGHALREQTFFASDDEQDSTTSPKTTLDADMKSSLELARQGSIGSLARVRTSHKHAASEGAAKLLAPNKAVADLRTSNSRNRAGSVPQKSRGQYLSLFPTPPKRSAGTTPISPLSPTAN